MDLDDLNKEQEEAVTNTEGPMLIIAGAGTGKTRVLISRILYLINEKKVNPKDILAITFTEKAANEMMERLDQVMPLSYEEVYIKTFHAFCDEILRESGLEIGLSTNYKLMNEVDQYLLLKKNLFKLDLDYYRPFGNPGRFIKAMLKHFSRLTDEDISPEKYLKYAEELRKKGAPASEEELEEIRKTGEIAESYKKYHELLMTNNALDFGSLHYFVLRLFEKRPNILKRYQQKFKYILVDEFQDTNFAQNKLIELLAQNHKNIMAVGDDDQSIYKFRGASVSNIMNFKKLFPEAKVIALTENYRSHQDVLNFVYQSIQGNNPERLEAKENINKKLLYAGESVFKEEKAVKVENFNNYLLEFEFIANEIINAKRSFKDFVILSRTNALAELIYQDLKRRGLPCSFLSNQGFKKADEIKDLISLLKFLSNLEDDTALFRVLSTAIFDLEMEKILEGMSKAKKFNQSLWQVVKNEASTTNLIDNNAEKFKKVRDVLTNSINYSKDHNVSQVVGKFFNDTDYLKKISSDEQNYEQVRNIALFSDKVATFEINNDDNRVKDFADYLDLIEEAGDETKGLEIALDEDSVKIMTIHTAKGLEFPVVFVPGLVNQKFPSTNRGDQIEIPEELIPEALPGGDFHIQEERRLFYVACTRAKEKLYLTSSKFYDGKKKWKKSIFLSELELGEKEDDKKKDEEIILTNNIFGDEKKGFDFKQDKIKPKIVLNDLSYSKLDTFETCPLKFKFCYFFNIPTLFAHAASFGSSVHNTLNAFYKVLQQAGSVDKDLLKKLYDQHWISLGYESKAHENTRKKKGWEILEKFYDQNSQPWIIPAYLERNFKLKMGELWLSGRIDRIDKLPDGTFEIIDYKTGTLKKNASLKNDLQLGIYAITAKEVFEMPLSKLSFYYLEENTKKSIDVTDSNLDKVAAKIREIGEKMKKTEFCPIPGFHCDFCNYRLICPAV